MTIEIRETIVTPTPRGELVQIHISDAPPDDERASFVLKILARTDAFDTPTLAHLQREAMKQAQDVLSGILPKMAAEIQSMGYDLNPKKKVPLRQEGVRMDDIPLSEP